MLDGYLCNESEQDEIPKGYHKEGENKLTKCTNLCNMTCLHQFSRGAFFFIDFGEPISNWKFGVVDPSCWE